MLNKYHFKYILLNTDTNLKTSVLNITIIFYVLIKSLFHTLEPCSITFNYFSNNLLLFKKTVSTHVFIVLLWNCWQICICICTSIENKWKKEVISGETVHLTLTSIPGFSFDLSTTRLSDHLNWHLEPQTAWKLWNVITHNIILANQK